MSDEDVSKNEMINSLRFANEFLKVTRNVQVATTKSDPLPDEILQHLANDQINDVINKFDLEPEMLIWGMVRILEIVMRFAELDPDELSEMIDHFIKWKEEKDAD